jgi:hypothetical protein
MKRLQSVNTTHQSISTPMHCFLFLVLSLPAHDIDEHPPSTSPRYHPSLVPTPVIHLVDLLISLAPLTPKRRTFFFSSTEMPPGPTLTSSKRPPTIAIHQSMLIIHVMSRTESLETVLSALISYGGSQTAYKSYLRKSR